MWAGNSGTQPGAGNGTCGSGTLANSLTGAGYSASYLSTNLGQVWQAPQGTSSTNAQYLYCDNSHPHQLTGLYSLGATCSNKTGQTYTSSYDAWGNVTGRTVNSTTATLSYDGLDHLTMYNAGSTSQEQYVYDASGSRVLRRSTSGSTTTMTVYAFGLEEHLYSGSGVHQSDTYYYSLGGMLVGEFDGTNTNMFLTDALGSVLETISATANTASVQGNQVYSPYGSSRYQQGTMGTSRGFTGQYNDSVSGLDYYGSRYYDPVVGRFLSADVLEGNLAGMDPYAYVGGNPETFSDPSGQRFAPPPGGGGDGGGDKSKPPTDTPPPGIGPSSSVLSQINNVSCDPSMSSASCFGSESRTNGPLVIVWGACGISGTGEVTSGLALHPGPSISVGGFLVSIPTISRTTTISSEGGVSGSCGEPTAVQTEGPSTPCLTNPLQCIVDSMGDEEAKGKEESYDPEFPPPHPLDPVEGDTLVEPFGKCSFTPDTAVATDHGQQAIGTLQVGERVLAYNPRTGKMEREPILHVWINHDHDLVDLTITTTTKGGHGTPATKTSEVIHTNQKHPFFTIEHGFLPVGQITLDMHLLRADGRVGVVTGWKAVPGTKVMYNLEVAQDHTNPFVDTRQPSGGGYLRKGQEARVFPLPVSPYGGAPEMRPSARVSLKKDEALFRTTVRCSSSRLSGGCLKSSAPFLPTRTV